MSSPRRFSLHPVPRLRITFFSCLFLRVLFTSAPLLHHGYVSLIEMCCNRISILSWSLSLVLSTLFIKVKGQCVCPWLSTCTQGNFKFIDTHIISFATYFQIGCPCSPIFGWFYVYLGKICSPVRVVARLEWDYGGWSSEYWTDWYILSCDKLLLN